MRQLTIQVPHGQAEDVLQIAQQHQATNTAAISGRSAGGEAVDVIIAHVENNAVGSLLDQLQQIDQMHVTLLPDGVFPMRPPADQVADQISDVTSRSPVEMFLSGVQSVGSWTAFLGYAAAAGAVVWIGLFTNTVYLLTAAMLIAPFAGPAMNASLSTARGDYRLLFRSLARYCAGLLITVVVAAALSLIMQQDVATSQMVEASQLSSTAVLLPLVAGAAGALNLSQSNHSSLVSGAATGMLVAASLAPPAALIGMAGVLRDWAMVQSGLYVLALQIVGINLSGAIVFRCFGIRPAEPRYARGTAGVFPITLSVTVVMLAALLTTQFWDSPFLQQSTRQQRARAVVHDVLKQSPLAHLVDSEVYFTGANIPGQTTLLAVVYAQAEQPLDGDRNAAAVKQQLVSQIEQEIRKQHPDVTPRVQLTLFDKPQGSKGR